MVTGLGTPICDKMSTTESVLIGQVGWVGDRLMLFMGLLDHLESSTGKIMA